MTQLGRIEAAQGRVLLNTDFHRQLGRVDTTDHEVNIKILLNDVVAGQEADRRAAQQAAGLDDR